LWPWQQIKNGGLEISLLLIKVAFIHKFVSQQQLKFADKQVNNYTIASKHEFAIRLAHGESIWLLF